MGKNKRTNYKETIEEKVVGEVLADALSKLTKSKSVTMQIRPFMEDIGMDISDSMLVEAFLAAYYVKTITYSYIAARISEVTGKEEDEITLYLKTAFNEWLRTHKELEEKYPKVTLLSILRVFIRKTSIYYV